MQREQRKRQVIRRRKQRAETRKCYTNPIIRDLRPMTPKLGSWWIWYIQCPKPDSRQWVKAFRSRFRLRHSSFVHVLKLLCDDRSGLFERWKQQGQADGYTPSFYTSASKSKERFPNCIAAIGKLEVQVPGRGLEVSSSVV